MGVSSSAPESAESTELVAATLAAIEKYRAAARADSEKRKDHVYQLWWDHDDDQGAMWSYTTTIRKFLITVKPACTNPKWDVQCKKDLISFCKEYCTIFDGWAADVYPAPGEVVEKRMLLVDQALAHVDRFRSCNGDYIHWTGYFMYAGSD